MQSFSTTEAAELLGVSTDTVRRWLATGKLRALPGDKSRRTIPGDELARFATAHAFAPEPKALGASSARNRFVGLVTAVKKDKVMAQVDLVSGDHRLVALISSEAVDELGLAPGVLAVATVKATNVVIERPEESGASH
ncbi:MAG: TOBE domain-containing protein [Acidimicrobiales bacterium]